MIADPSYESVQLAGKITEMGKSFGKPVYIVLNKVDEQQRQLMEEQLAGHAAVIAAVGQDSEILNAGLKGEKLEKQVDGVDRIISILTERRDTPTISSKTPDLFRSFLLSASKSSQ